MSDAFAIERDDWPGRGRYVMRLSGDLEAELTFRWIGRDTIGIDHTFVPPAHRGNNLALQLIERAVADARRDGLRIKPECSYAVTQFRRHPDWADLIA